MASTVARLGTTLVLAASAVTGLAPVAHADTAPYEMPRLVPSGAGYDAALRAAADIWTTGRIAAAALNDDTGGAVGRGADSVPPADGWGDLAEPVTGQGPVTTTTGKLLMRLNNAATGEYSHLSACTASVVQSANRSVVVTAGHCFREQLASTWPVLGTNYTTAAAVFIPGFDGSSLTRVPGDLSGQAINDWVANTPLPGPDVAPYGVWPVTRTWLTYTWAREKNNFHGNDMAAFLVDSPDVAAPIQDVTGGQAIAFDRPRGEPVDMFGYPTANRTTYGTGQWYAPQYDGSTPLFGQPGANGVPAGQVRTYDGRSLFVSRGGTTLDAGDNYDDILPMAQAQGSSGGPWFQDFDAATGQGTLVGVTSHFVGSTSGGFEASQGWNPARPYMAGTHFAAQEQAAYQAAATATP